MRPPKDPAMKPWQYHNPVAIHFGPNTTDEM